MVLGTVTCAMTSIDCSEIPGHRKIKGIIMSHTISLRPPAYCAVMLALAFAGPTSRAGTLTLAQDGHTDYVIVIATEAEAGEEMAAKELALFLGKMTGARFPITRDDTAPQAHEIVLGDTNRKARADVPSALRTENMERFAIWSEGQRLLIMGNVPRGTLYGVYDFLDVELGVRFLAHAVTHVPQRSTLKVTIDGRTYGPPLERRTLWEGTPQGSAIVRQRLNGLSFQVIHEKTLGGVKMVGRPTHTYAAFVPPEKYFDNHFCLTADHSWNLADFAISKFF